MTFRKLTQGISATGISTPQRRGWGLTLTSAGPEVFLYEGVDVPAEKVNKDVKLAV